MCCIFFLLIIGFGGFIIFIWLGVWQLQCLEWKEVILVDIDVCILVFVMVLLENFVKDLYNYMFVEFMGMLIVVELWVLLFGIDVGIGYCVVLVWNVNEWCIFVDMGFLLLGDLNNGLCLIEQIVQGNMLWLDDVVDKLLVFEGDLWFVCDVDVMVEVFQVELFMVVLCVLSCFDL